MLDQLKGRGYRAAIVPATRADDLPLNVGHQLLDWAEGLAYSRGLGNMRVHVPAADRASQRLYEGHSFVPRPAADRPEVIVMDKRLLG